jgi:hypothetical protein
MSNWTVTSRRLNKGKPTTRKGPSKSGSGQSLNTLKKEQQKDQEDSKAGMTSYLVLCTRINKIYDGAGCTLMI